MEVQILLVLLKRGVNFFLRQIVLLPLFGIRLDYSQFSLREFPLHKNERSKSLVFDYFLHYELLHAVFVVITWSQIDLVGLFVSVIVVRWHIIFG